MMTYKYLLSLVMVCVLMLDEAAYTQTNKSTGANATDFEIKGFHLDLRIQVMTPEALLSFADELSDLGINTLVMEWEGTFPYQSHATIPNEFSYTLDEVRDFIMHCESIGISVIPLQQSLGHVEYILRNPRYGIIKEDRKDISQLCPMEVVDNEALFTDLFSELAAVHNSDYIHIGGDETYLLGHCEKCRTKVEKEGKSKLFVDHMKMIANLVIAQGKKPVMWADIILKYPEAAEELPKETIFVDWNYGWKINHFGDVAGLQQKGFTFWGAPSIRSHPDNWYVTGWSTHFKNQKEFIPYARQANYKGIIMTSWSTTGVYGFTWDVGYDVIDMVQIRNTYPMSGFKILIASYAKALNTNEPIDPKSFVLAYAKSRFGLNSKDAQILWEFLSADPELIKNGKPERSASIEAMQSKYEKHHAQLSCVQPSKNKKEFAHFKLMADLRMHYLDFKKVEAIYNATDFSPLHTPSLLTALDRILEDAKTLDARFYELNSGFIYDSELKEQHALRIQPIEVLYNRLAKLK